MILLQSQYRRVEQLAYNADGSRLIGFGEQISDPPRAGVVWWDCQNDYAPNRGIAGCATSGGFCVLPDGGLVVTLPPVSGTYHSRAVSYNANGDSPLDLLVNHTVFFAPVLAACGDHLLVGSYGNPSEIYRFRLPLVAPVEPIRRHPVTTATIPATAFCRAFEVASRSDEFFALENDLDAARVQRRSIVSLEPVGDAIPVMSHTNAIRLAVGETRLISIAGASLYSHDLTDPKKPPVKKASGNRKHFTGIAVHPDGRRVLATCNDTTVREYDAVTLQEIRAYAWKVGRLRSVAVAPDGLTAAAGSDSGKVVVWDLE